MFVPVDNTKAPYLHSPYWAKVWPAAIGMSMFLHDNLGYIEQKTVLELAAGLGFPSLFVARIAKHVIVTDIEPEAVSLIAESAAHNGLDNIDCRVVDWGQPGDWMMAETVLLSDVNYEPAQFILLAKMILRFINNDSTVILSTPQRLMAKPFITQFLPYVHRHSEVCVSADDTAAIISVFVFAK